MITSIELGDFLAHSETKIKFKDGVTIFVGDNGAGKSSIIDAITFSLFGQHTRKSNKGLIRRGANQGFTKIKFTINGKQYETVRKIDSKGSLAATFSEITNNERVEIAAGERKQFGESMTEQVEKIIGMDFEKLKIASIVQQGELNSIINAKPKEFKELLNAIIGIDKLDVASESMKKVTKEFREKIRTDLGYDDTHIEILERDFEKYQQDIKEAEPEKNQLELKQKEIQEELKTLQKELEIETPKIDKIKQLELRKNELLTYVKDTIEEIRQQISENERKIRDCKGCFEEIKLKGNFEIKIQKIEEAVEETLKKIQEMSSQIASLKEKQILASKLQLKDNKCPVCDSTVEKLNPFFQEEHIKDEINRLQGDIKLKEKERDMYSQKRKEFLEKVQKTRDAEATLRAHSINNEEEVIKIQKETQIQKEKLPLLNNNNLKQISQIDNHAELIFQNISKLEVETKGFNEKEFLNLKKTIIEKQTIVSQIDQQMGGVLEKIDKAKKQIETIQKSILELKKVKEYILRLDKIQMNIFSRDGSVATSLRSWALNSISVKASEYLSYLNTKIQRIALSEKARDVSIACYSKTEVLELESLSGGEKVSVALALRLGMASLLGSSNLNLMILDEPTTHLDAERKKSLVRVLSQLSEISNSQSPMQFLIITHDAEIFEDSNVEQIYKFESSDEGSKVIEI
ncbi:MAG: AAA family ATPase [Nitrosopumilus sp.]|jgi:exonuclease SbcC|nr:AAA family ATPase [Nitrosopumilus sp.]MBT3861618.1 AAA family ATPase [Nitrosopumilus sp.]MBT3955849.1 AAA family ATPase [Nitrosopumilus sp.]MBT4536060.1 AAA family ATPase [Nitrosopumilus sp.]MBT4955496.1 AAA family ATPase [Nitrosopumilus sp.]